MKTKDQQDRDRQYRSHIENVIGGDRFQYLYGLIMRLYQDEIPSEEFSLLGIAHDSTEPDIKSAFRAKMLEAHPDKGGNQEDCIRLIMAKNKCLEYVTTKNFN